MRVYALTVLLFIQPLLVAQTPSLSAAQMASQQAQRDAAEAQRQANSGLQAHQQATRLSQSTPPVIRTPVTQRPRFSPKPGTYRGSVPQVTITDRTKGAVIYFTTDGSSPTVNSQQYAGPIAVSATTTVKAIAVAPMSANSPIARGEYVVR